MKFAIMEIPQMLDRSVFTASKVVFALALWSAGLSGQTLQNTGATAAVEARALVRLIPALGYGQNSWSILRLANRSASVKTVGVEVFRQNGERLPIGPEVRLNPNDSIDLRIEAPANNEETCWAAITEYSNTTSPEVSVRGFVEVLNGNQVEAFERELHVPAEGGAWSLPTSDLRGKTLYFLNVSEMPTTINFCEVKQPKQYACVAERRHVSSYNLGARQSMLFDLENFR
ncbi:MAG: hypothetical protein JO336_18280, partial [Acidobacteriia bacterium]|nr:hypothetical protein [Terriglobia bacterium]